MTFETGDFPRNRYGLTSYNPITHANLKDEEGENIGIAAIAQGKDILVNAGFSVSLSGHQPQDVVIPVYEAHKDIDGKKLGIVFADKATGGSDPVKHRGKSGFVLVSEKGDVVCSDNETYLMDSRDPYIGKLVIIKDDNGPKQARVAAQKYGDRKTYVLQAQTFGPAFVNNNPLHDQDVMEISKKDLKILLDTQNKLLNDQDVIGDDFHITTENLKTLMASYANQRNKGFFWALGYKHGSVAIENLSKLAELDDDFVTLANVREAIQGRELESQDNATNRIIQHMADNFDLFFKPIVVDEAAQLH